MIKKMEDNTHKKNIEKTTSKLKNLLHNFCLRQYRACATLSLFDQFRTCQYIKSVNLKSIHSYIQLKYYQKLLYKTNIK